MKHSKSLESVILLFINELYRKNKYTNKKKKKNASGSLIFLIVFFKLSKFSCLVFLAL